MASTSTIWAPERDTDMTVLTFDAASMMHIEQ
jgi:hypothetical protein